jgi:hypothetical protein
LAFVANEASDDPAKRSRAYIKEDREERPSAAHGEVDGLAMPLKHAIHEVAKHEDGRDKGQHSQSHADPVEPRLDTLCAHGATLSQSASKSYMLSAMDQDATPVERAFELAKSGSYGSIDDIKKRLRADGYSVEQIEGKTLSKQLRALIKKARS